MERGKSYPGKSSIQKTEYILSAYAFFRKRTGSCSFPPGNTTFGNEWGTAMVTINSLTDSFMGLVEKGWMFGGWWFVGGALSVFVVLCMGMQRSSYR